MGSQWKCSEDAGGRASGEIELPRTTSSTAPARVPRAQRLELLTLSAPTPHHLMGLATGVRERIGEADAPAWAAASRARPVYPSRMAVLGGGIESLARSLTAFVDGHEHDEVFHGRAESANAGSIAFVFPNEASQWDGMGTELLADEPVFREAVQACATAMEPFGMTDLMLALRGKGSWSIDLDVLGPCVFAMQVGLAAMWQDVGLIPDAVFGFGVGEIAAAHVAGILDLRSAAELVCRQSQCLRDAQGTGLLLMVDLSPSDTKRMLAALGLDRDDGGPSNQAWIAIEFGPSSTVVAGGRRALQVVHGALRASRIAARWLPLELPAHSPALGHTAAQLERELCDASLQPHGGTAMFFSARSGHATAGEELGPAYWRRACTEAVRFATAIEQMEQAGVTTFVEVSPHPMLAAPLASADPARLVLASMRRAQDTRRELLSGVAMAFCRGHRIAGQAPPSAAPWPVGDWTEPMPIDFDVAFEPAAPVVEAVVEPIVVVEAVVEPDLEPIDVEPILEAVVEAPSSVPEPPPFHQPDAGDESQPLLQVPSAPRTRRLSSARVAASPRVAPPLPSPSEPAIPIPAVRVESAPLRPAIRPPSPPVRPPIHEVPPEPAIEASSDPIVVDEPELDIDIEIEITPEPEPELVLEPPPDDVYVTTWIDVEAPSTPAKGARVVVFAIPGGFGSSMVPRLRDLGIQCVVVEPGERFAALGVDRYAIDPADPASVRAMLTAARRTGPVAGVLQLWTAESVDTTLARLVEAQREGLLATAVAARALLADGPATPLWIVTRGAQSVDGREDLAIGHRPVWGLGVALADEAPELECRTIDLSRGDAPDVAARALALELACTGAEPLVAWRSGRRCAARWMRRDVEVPPPKRFARDGTIIVTGDLGGTGLDVATWLHGRGARNLALIGHAMPPARVQAKIAALRGDGAEIRTFNCDVADAEALTRVLKTVRRVMPPIHGVFHAGGDPAPLGLGELDASRHEALLRNKLHGAFNLHTLTAGDPIEDFVLFSSASVLLGGAGQLASAVANAFGEALASARRRAGRPGLAVQWGHTTTPGVEPLPIDVALHRLGQLLGSNLAEVAILGLRPAAWRSARTSRPRPLLDALPDPSPEADGPTVDAPANPRSRTKLSAVSDAEVDQLLQAALG